MKKNVLALILVLCMAVSMLPMTAFAAQTQPVVKTAPATLPNQMEKLPGISVQASYTVSLTGGSHGQTEMLVSSPAAAGSEVYFLANPDDGYLAEVYVSGIDPSELIYYGFDIWAFIMPSNKVSIEVKYVAVSGSSHKITLNTAKGGQAILDRTSAKENESVYLAVRPDPRSTFIPEQHVSVTYGDMYYLYEDEGIHYYELFMPNRDVTINVTFVLPSNPITVTVETGLGGSASTNVSAAKPGDTVRLTCSPDAGYRVAQITGVRNLTDNGNGSYTFTMPDEAVNLSVLFLRNDNPFLDVNETHYFYNSVLWAARNGITNGVDATHFGPAQPCTRAQVVTFLWSAAGKPAPTLTVNPFTDVPAGAWFEAPVLWAVEKGITSGTSHTTFGPGEPSNRSQVVTFLYSSAGKPAITGTNPFTDVPAGAWFEKPVLWALKNGITSGTSATTFGPGDQCLRAQVVTFLYKADQIPTA